MHQYSGESVLKLQLLTAQEHAKIRRGDANIDAKGSKVEVNDGKISLQAQQEDEVRRVLLQFINSSTHTYEDEDVMAQLHGIWAEILKLQNVFGTLSKLDSYCAEVDRAVACHTVHNAEVAFELGCLAVFCCRCRACYSSQAACAGSGKSSS